MTPTPSKTYSGPERRVEIPLSETQIEAIAEKAAEKAIERLTGDVYKAVGRSVITKFVWVVGASVVGFWLWAKGKGLIP